MMFQYIIVSTFFTKICCL